MRRHLDKKVTVMTETKADRILVENGRATGLLLSNGNPVSAKAVISAPGRVGAEWVKKEAHRLRLPLVPSPVDIGVRVEAPAAILERLTDAAYEAKLIYYSKSFDDRLRTFCMNPYGEVVSEGSDHIVIVNGHSYAAKRTENTNFAILVSSTFTEPFDDPIAYGKYIARLANVLGKGIIIQRLGDLLKGRRSTPERIAKCATRPTFLSATPGDLSFVLPYRHLKGIIEMLEAMDKLTPGVFSRHTLLYGVEVKFYSHRLAVSERLESKVENLFFVGDGAGITRGLLQASVSGLLAGREVAKRLKRPGETPRLSKAPKQSPPGKKKRSAEPFITAQK
jgi:uncharacterized FAD-dependent dehydrogenase